MQFVGLCAARSAAFSTDEPALGPGPLILAHELAANQNKNVALPSSGGAPAEPFSANFRVHNYF